MTMQNDDLLSAAAPEQALSALRHIADKFAEDAQNLKSAWQDNGAGKFWEVLSRELRRAADKAEKHT